MNIITNRIRFVLIIDAILFGLIAFLVIIFVIPPVETDTFPLATPERSTIAFWVAAVLHLLIGIVLYFRGLRFPEKSRRTSILFIVLGGFSILLALALAVAAIAFQSHGPSLLTATSTLFICTAAELLAGILLIIISVIPRKRN